MGIEFYLVLNSICITSVVSSPKFSGKCLVEFDQNTVPAFGLTVKDSPLGFVNFPF